MYSYIHESRLLIIIILAVAVCMCRSRFRYSPRSFRLPNTNYWFDATNDRPPVARWRAPNRPPLLLLNCHRHTKPKCQLNYPHTHARTHEIESNARHRHHYGCGCVCVCVLFFFASSIRKCYHSRFHTIYIPKCHFISVEALLLFCFSFFGNESLVRRRLK